MIHSYFPFGTLKNHYLPAMRRAPPPGTANVQLQVLNAGTCIILHKITDAITYSLFNMSHYVIVIFSLKF